MAKKIVLKSAPPVVDPKQALTDAIAKLNDEALSYVALAVIPSNEIPGGKVWPDGIGGFTDKAGINAVRAAARAYLKLGQ